METEYESIPDAIDRFEAGRERKELVVVNRTEPDAVQRLLEGSLGGEVPITERRIPDGSENVVLLVEGDAVLATSSLQEVMDTFLLINSDIYRTGLLGFDTSRLPDVLMRMDETVLSLRGYPTSNKEKLLLIGVSRYIEGLAHDTNTGRLDAGFQRLDRLNDEFGTRRVYEHLAASDVDVHVYGVPGATPNAVFDMDVAVHTDDTEEYRRSWFVVYTPRDDGDRSAALVAWERGENVWDSLWTFDADWVRGLQRYVVEDF